MICTSVKSRNSSNPKWWDNDCNAAKRNKMLTLRTFRLSNNRNDLQTYKTCKNRFKSLCKGKKLNYQRKKRNDLINNRKDPKQFWGIIKSSCTKCHSNGSISSHEWFKYFKNLLNLEKKESENFNENILQNLVLNNNCDDLNVQITDDEIIRSVNSLKNQKSPGPDGICAEMYKHTLNDTLPYLNKLFNEIFDSSIVPKEWCYSIITPIHKKGSLSNPNNYRGISLIDCICKIFVTILITRLSNWCDECNIIDEAQAGFRKHYSTIDNSFILMSLTQKYLSKKKG